MVRVVRQCLVVEGQGADDLSAQLMHVRQITQDIGVVRVENEGTAKLGFCGAEIAGLGLEPPKTLPYAAVAWVARRDITAQCIERGCVATGGNRIDALQPFLVVVTLEPARCGWPPNKQIGKKRSQHNLRWVRCDVTYLTPAPHPSGVKMHEIGFFIVANTA